MNLTVLDLETTGGDIEKDRIVQIALKLVRTVNGKRGYIDMTTLVNPEMPISPEATAIHGISDADVADFPTFKEVAPQILEAVSGDIAGYNILNFDIPVLIMEFHRAGIDWEPQGQVLDSFRTWLHKYKRDLATACEFYGVPAPTKSHDAMSDVNATYEMLKAQFRMYKYKEMGDMANDCYPGIVDYHGVLKLVDNLVTFNVGKHVDKSVIEVWRTDPKYMDWALANFKPNTVKHLKMSKPVPLGTT